MIYCSHIETSNYIKKGHSEKVLIHTNLRSLRQKECVKEVYAFYFLSSQWQIRKKWWPITQIPKQTVDVLNKIYKALI